MKNNKKKSGAKKGVKLHKWTEYEVEYLKKHYGDTRAEDIGKVLYRSARAVRHKANKIGLRSNLLPSNNKGSFKKGNIPWNKGKKHLAGYEKWFQKGHVPWNTKDVGAIWVRKTKGIDYKYIKTEEGTKIYSRYIYEQHHGKIPANHIIRYKDGDTLNCDIENLICVSRSEHARMNARPAKAGRTNKINKAGGYINALLMGKI